MCWTIVSGYILRYPLHSLPPSPQLGTADAEIKKQLFISQFLANLTGNGHLWPSSLRFELVLLPRRASNGLQADLGHYLQEEEEEEEEPIIYLYIIFSQTITHNDIRQQNK